MSKIGRRVRAAVNPVSTAATRWWCLSAPRRMLTGHGPTAAQRRLIREQRAGRLASAADLTASAELMKSRARALDDQLSKNDPPA
jgi:hypothetical protein